MAYTIEEEQEINEIKNWWNENYKTIIVAVFFLLVVLSVGVIGKSIKLIRHSNCRLNMNKLFMLRKM